tara:strand:+ start:12859 stop:13761 length:903 start_codon:yes stop_codon:yes gene_type:complete
MKKIIIIGSGSISKKHAHSLKKLKYKIKLNKISSRQFDKFKNPEMKKLMLFKPDLIIICSPATSHFNHFKKIEKNFNMTKVLIEKPVFEKNYIIHSNLRNKYFVGYNLRFHPVISFIKKFLNNKTLFSINVNSHSYLPKWRKINYRKSVSAKKELGGGALLELSHELDYLIWIFDKFKILYSFNSHISDLKINSDDVLALIGKVKKNTLLTINLNFFSKISSRTIKVDGKNFSLNADLIKNKIIIINGKKKQIIKFSNFNIKDTYDLQCNDIINNKFMKICTLKQSLKLMKIIDGIKKND